MTYLKDTLELPGGQVAAFGNTFDELRELTGYAAKEAVEKPLTLQERRDRLKAFFTEKQGETLVSLGTTEISTRAEMAINGVSSIMGNSTLDPKRFGGLADKSRVNLSSLLVELEKTSDQVQAFQDEFDRMREAVGYKSKPTREEGIS